MHSSTSNSETVRYSANKPVRIATVALIVLVLAIMAFSEIASRYVFPRISRIESRIRNDELQVAAIRSSGPGSPPVVLLVGNSLL